MSVMRSAAGRLPAVARDNPGESKAWIDAVSWRLEREVQQSYGGLDRASRHPPPANIQPAIAEITKRAGVTDQFKQECREKGDAGTAALLRRMGDAAASFAARDYSASRHANWYFVTEFGKLRREGFILGEQSLSAVLMTMNRSKGPFRAELFYRRWLGESLPDSSNAPPLLMHAWARNGAVERIVGLWKDAVARGHSPTRRWYSALLIASEGEGAKRARNIRETMQGRGLELSGSDRTAYVRCARGVAEAEELAEEAGLDVRPGAPGRSALLSGAVASGDVDAARSIFAQLSALPIRTVDKAAAVLAACAAVEQAGVVSGAAVQRVRSEWEWTERTFGLEALPDRAALKVLGVVAEHTRSHTGQSTFLGWAKTVFA
eukprot:Hpha_TRINITY_DN31849_c0_g1::TRINITY_DN31849_c0_g1_i1::g.29939::m.29939